MRRLLLLALWPMAWLAAQPAPTAATRRTELETTLRAELLAQRAFWQADEVRVHGLTRHPQQTEPEMQRLAMMHCHTDRFYAPATSLLATPRNVSSAERRPPPYPLPSLIASTAYKTAICPMWAVPPIDDSPLSGPRHALLSSQPALAVPFSDSLRTRLEGAAQQFPTEPWFMQQLVRVLTENGDTARAIAVTQTCAPTRTDWCAMLHVYALITARDWPAAHRAYRAALARLDRDQRCVYRSAEFVLPPATFDAYMGQPCATRDTVDATVWWLSTPLFADGANLRELEHVARVIHQQLAEALPFDAHHDLHRETGGDAVAEMRVRYGWPQHLFWTGEEEDKSHWHYQEANNAPPFPVAEYSRLNTSSLVSWRAVQRPLTLTDADYPATSTTRTVSNRSPWPREFFLHPRGPIARLAPPQRVLLRRDSGALVIVAATLASAGGEALPAGRGRAVLLHSAGPDVVSPLETRAATRGERVLLQGLARTAGVVSLEYLLDAPTGGSARTRAGIGGDVFRPLPSGRCAVSEPILLDASAVERPGLAVVEAGMLSSTRLVRPTRLGVAWESYGFRERDSVTISLRVSGSATQTTLEKTGRLFRLGADPRVGLTMSWTEPNPSHAVTAVDATTPTLLRALALDVSALRAGEYRLELSMERLGCPAVTSQRALTVVR